MKDSPADLYDEHYYRHYCGSLPYERSEGWLRFFGGVADRIVQDLAPRTVLDAGCALALLVESLRDRNVEAFGIDISEYAIANVRPDIAPFCWQGSITEPLPRRYDLIVSIEVLEHLPRPAAEAAVANLCRHTDDVLFSSSPIDYRETTHFNVQPPEYWADLFLRQGFVRDVDCDASFITSWAVRFRRQSVTMQRLVHDYERRFWPVWKENAELRSLVNELRGQLIELERNNDALKTTNAELQSMRQRLADIEQSLSWRMVKSIVPPVQRALLPKDSLGGRILAATIEKGGARLVRAKQTAADWRDSASAMRERLGRNRQSRAFDVPPLTPAPPLGAHVAPVDVIVCVHDALDDVTRCLASLVRYTRPPYRIVLVDDGSDAPARDYLARFAAEQGATLLRNEHALGYTRAANQGLRASTAAYALLLNSDTIVTRDWLDRMVACAEADARIGLVGPLSNTASWQSVPRLFDDGGDWAENALPGDWAADTFARALAARSPRNHPRVGFLNGFCLLVKRALVSEIGVFDEERFGRGYGEENDYCLRARAAGWELAVADDAYVYHAQSKSYGHDGRRERIEQADRTLVDKHGHEAIARGLGLTRENRLLAGTRARARVLAERQQLVDDGRKRFEGKRVLILLPIVDPAGGGHVVLQEARAMRAMGVDARVLNLEESREGFERGHPENGVPIVYAPSRERVAQQLAGFDAVIATAHGSVEWMQLSAVHPPATVRAYYVQDFEPFFYPPGSESYWSAWRSYTRFADLVLLTKTEWNRATVQAHVGADCAVVGPSVDIDLFCPRPRRDGSRPERPLRVAAMIRPQTPRRQARLTMEVLGDFQRAQGNAVEIVLFGCDSDDPAFLELPSQFAWRNAGVVTRPQLASLMNEIDVFADFSSFQAMGLAALEAMATGAAVIVPKNGGATSFARHEANSLVVDTSSAEACRGALERLFQDPGLTSRLREAALEDACGLHPEGAAYRILEKLFPAAPPAQ